MDYLVTIGEETMGGWGSGADYTNEFYVENLKNIDVTGELLH